MQQCFKLAIEYDGTAYHGWQRQKALPTIQGTIEAALKIMTEQSTTVVGSGRTDAGVHAWRQVAHFAMDTALTADVFRNGLNSLLPEDIVITHCEHASDSFHARYDVISKIYEYVIVNRRVPVAISRKYAWHVRTKLDLESMKEALACLKGTHDFSAFEGAGSARSTSVRTVMNAHLAQRDGGDYLLFSIEADGFLRFMVRNIVGTLVDVGKRKTSPDGFESILRSGDRKRAGATAPAHGLFLKQVKY
jgi:tRNA pseudouridine38-40 synthase